MDVPITMSTERGRLQWSATPLERVGPLDFGVGREESLSAVGDGMVESFLQSPRAVCRV